MALHAHRDGSMQIISVDAMKTCGLSHEEGRFLVCTEEHVYGT
jgi:hypothetical protein